MIGTIRKRYIISPQGGAPYSSAHNSVILLDGGGVAGQSGGEVLVKLQQNCPLHTGVALREGKGRGGGAGYWGGVKKCTRLDIHPDIDPDITGYKWLELLRK